MTYHIQPADLPVEVFAETAAETGAVFVANHEVFAREAAGLPEDTYLLHDGWHPNAAGYRIIAQNVFEAIEAHDLLDAPRASD